MDSKLEQSRWWRVVAQIIEESHTASDDDLPRVIAEAVGLVGITAQMYLVDLAQRTLWPVPKDDRGPVPVEGSLVLQPHLVILEVLSLVVAYAGAGLVASSPVGPVLGVGSRVCRMGAGGQQAPNLVAG
jgi:hypothetical protein